MNLLNMDSPEESMARHLNKVIAERGVASNLQLLERIKVLESEIEMLDKGLNQAKSSFRKAIALLTIQDPKKSKELSRISYSLKGQKKSRTV